MNEYRDVLARARAEFPTPELPLRSVYLRRDRKRRRARVRASIVAGVLAVVSLAVVFRTFGIETTQPSVSQSWVKVPAPTGLPAQDGLHGVTSWEGMYVAVAYRESQDGFVTSFVSSTDGATWEQRAVLAQGAFVFALDSDGKRLIAGGFDRGGGAIWVSDDATTWKRVGLEGGGGKVFGVAITGDRYFAWGFGAMWSSLDGLTWEMAPGAESLFRSPAIVTGVTAGGPGYVAWGQGTYVSNGAVIAGVWTSPDGIRWRRVPEQASLEGDETGGAMTDVLRTDDGLVGFGAPVGPGNSPSEVAWTSPDGLTWTRVEVSGHVTFVNVIEVNSGFVAAGGGIWSSSDGTTWTEDVPMSDNCSLLWVTDGPAGLVAVGGHSWCIWTTAPAAGG
jgi:hypothetical protein